jgi:hypothetical protein
MAEFTLEEAYADPTAKPKPVVDPRLVQALAPKDQRSLNVSEANRRAEEERKIAEEKRATARKIEEENRAIAQKLAEEKRKEENPMGSITEGERKASTLLTRMQSSTKQLEDVLKQYPNAAKPEYLSSFVEGISETGANLIRSTPRQQIETAQKDIVDAYLTASTGATYTPIQFKEFKEFLFPQIGDDLPTLKDKENRLKTAIEAVRLQAGRAAKLVPDAKSGNQPPANAPPTAKQAPDGKWYAPDPARPGKYLQY